MEEIWKDIKGYEGFFQVSNTGKVKSLKRKIKAYNRYACVDRTIKEKILKYRLTRTGYCRVGLHIDGKGKDYYVHRLVAEAFLPNPNNLPQVNHIDGNKMNNNITNLEWVTVSENAIHAIKTNLRTVPTDGKRGKDNKKSIEILQIDKETKQILRLFQGMREAERLTGIKSGDICRCCKSERKTAGGYIWRYKEEQ